MHSLCPIDRANKGNIHTVGSCTYSHFRYRGDGIPLFWISNVITLYNIRKHDDSTLNMIFSVIWYFITIVNLSDVTSY